MKHERRRRGRAGGRTRNSGSSFATRPDHARPETRSGDHRRDWRWHEGPARRRREGVRRARAAATSTSAPSRKARPSGSLSCVVDAAQQARALNVIHQAFFERAKSLALVVVGVGNVGGALLAAAAERRAISLRTAGSTRAWSRSPTADASSSSATGSISPGWRETLDASGRTHGSVALAHEVAGLELSNAALVDCTADASLVDAYPAFVERTCTSSRRISGRTCCRGGATRP